MNKKYIIITFISYLSIFSLMLIIIYSDSVSYITMSSIFIPIIVGALFNYDSNVKKIYNKYYEPLYHYIATYHDIMSQPSSRLKIGKKHEMMSSISRDIILFLNNNLEYSKDSISEIQKIILFYEYENNGTNELQDINDINRLIPLLMKQIMENYNVLNINHYIKRKRYILKDIPQKVNFLMYLFCDSFILNIARKEEYALTLYECIETYSYIQQYRLKNFKKYFELRAYCLKNIETDNDINIKNLKEKFGINIQKIKV